MGEAAHCIRCDAPYADRTGVDPCPRCGEANSKARAKVSNRLKVESQEKTRAEGEAAARLSEQSKEEARRRDELDRRAREERTRAAALKADAPAKALPPEDAASRVLCGRCASDILAGATVCPWCGFGRIVPISASTVQGYAIITGIVIGVLAGGFCRPEAGAAAGVFSFAITMIFYGRESEHQEQRLGKLVKGQLEKN